MNQFKSTALSLLILPTVASTTTFAQQNDNQSRPSWLNNVTPSALIEVEGFYSDTSNGPSESDVTLATVEFGVIANITKQLTAEVVFLFEEDETDLEVDVATLNYAFEGSSLNVLAGQTYLPFGAFESAFISDPLTLEIGETRETTLALTHQGNNLSAALYLFNGDVDEGGQDQIDGFGANLAYTTEPFSFGIGYINSLGDSDTLQNSLESTDVDKQTEGLALDATFKINKLTLIAEYITALDEFDDAALVGQKPSATNVEINYDLNLLNKPAILAFAYQTTDDSLALELPQTRLLAGVGFDLSNNIHLGFEVAYDDDYDINDGGTGDSSTTLTIQFAARF